MQLLKAQRRAETGCGPGRGRTDLSAIVVSNSPSGIVHVLTKTKTKFSSCSATHFETKAYLHDSSLFIIIYLIFVYFVRFFVFMLSMYLLMVHQLFRMSMIQSKPYAIIVCL